MEDHFGVSVISQAGPEALPLAACLLRGWQGPGAPTDTTCWDQKGPVLMAKWCLPATQRCWPRRLPAEHRAALILQRGPRQSAAAFLLQQIQASQLSVKIICRPCGIEERK